MYFNDIPNLQEYAKISLDKVELDCNMRNPLDISRNFLFIVTNLQTTWQFPISYSHVLIDVCIPLEDSTFLILKFHQLCHQPSMLITTIRLKTHYVFYH